VRRGRPAAAGRRLYNALSPERIPKHRGEGDVRQALVRILATVGGIVVFGMLLMLFTLALGGGAGGGSVPSRVLLEVDFTAGLAEGPAADPFALAFGGGSPTVLDTVAALDRAAKDERVVGLVARVGSGIGGVASVQELRAALARFRASGKPALAFAESFAFGPSGTVNYYLASAFDEIYLQPIGNLNFAGLAANMMFLRGTLDKLEVVAQVDGREEYKSAKNQYTEKQMTPADEEAFRAVLQSQFGAVVADVARDRELAEDEVRKLADRGFFTAQEAVDVKLIDGVAYREEVYKKLRERAGDEPELLFLSAYGQRTLPSRGSKPTFALIYGVGAIGQGESQFSPFGGAMMGSDTVSAAFRAAIEDDAVKAILFRVDSPGGSAVASQAIWDETRRARAAGKPVIVSMGDVAGSGGYFVAMSADKIVAQPGTITGSIGVVTGKFVTRKLYEKLGITYDGVQTSANANLWSEVHDFTPEQWKQLQLLLDDVYQQFTQGVAEGRRLPHEKVLEVAKGRIWTGADAQTRGLVDEVGGFDTALRLAKVAAGVPEEEEVWLQLFPRQRTPVEQILAQLGGERRDSSDDVASRALARLAERLPLEQIWASLEPMREPVELRMPLVPRLAPR
jgi:protease-4